MTKIFPKPGVLYLIPTPLLPETLYTLSPDVIRVLHQTHYYIVENARTARRFIKSTQPPYTIDTLHIVELDKHDSPDPRSLLIPAFEGNDIGILSEAGCPGIADPGSVIVQYAHAHDLRVIPLTGPSSILLALMASGLNGQRFQFHGYLTPKKDRIAVDLRKLEENSRKEGSTQIFIETPYRNMQVFEAALKVLMPTTLLCVAVDLTSEQEYIHTRTIGKWQISAVPELHKRPAVFCILAM
jgi:16S rRNA (cytidine1402-2'-O)-methyltransferase